MTDTDTTPTATVTVSKPWNGVYTVLLDGSHVGYVERRRTGPGRWTATLDTVAHQVVLAQRAPSRTAAVRAIVESCATPGVELVYA